MGDQTYFTVREQSLHGDCQTIYNIHPLPVYEAMEIEEQLETAEKTQKEYEHQGSELSQGRLLCQGKKYWQITKTRDFDNCIERPVFQKWYGLRSQCDTTKANCRDLMTHMSASNYIVCGNDIRDFVIRKSITKNTIATSVAWNTEEKIMNKAEIVMELLKKAPMGTPLVLPSSLKEIKSLIFEYPESTLTSAQPLKLSEEIKDRIQSESGVRPILPLPDLISAPKMLIPVNLVKEDTIRQVIAQFLRVAQEIFLSPESCTSKGDVAGHLNIVAKALRPLSLADLKLVETKLENEIVALPISQQKLIRTLFYDVVAMIGTNPAIMLVKERIVDTTRIDAVQAVSMIQSVVGSVRTPTPELLQELITLVKDGLKPLSQERTILYNIAIVQVSNLLHKACICPSKHAMYPERIFGVFCEKDDEFIGQWISWLGGELEIEQNVQIKLNIITALGKVGHVHSARILTTLISDAQNNEMVRSLAVYSLKKAATLNPSKVKPILMTIIENISEHSEVRIAAIATLPYAH